MSVSTSNVQTAKEFFRSWPVSSDGSNENSAISFIVIIDA